MTVITERVAGCTVSHYTGVSSGHSHKANTDLGLFSRHIAVGPPTPWNV